ncbi:MAG: FecR domain-containing protein [Bacteroidia bacterium]|nr:FecR domain-containing protein [Bacteroidia bacterium]
MDFEKYIIFTTEEFVLDNEFIAWVLHPKTETDMFWSEFLSSHPEKRDLVKEAAFIIKALQPVEEEIPAERFDDIMGRIQSKSKGQRKKVLVNVLKYAAVIAGVIGITGVYYLLNLKQDPFPLATLATDAVGKGKVILPDGSSIEFDAKETVIRQTASGKLLINSDTVTSFAQAKTMEASALNQVIIPYGKRSQVTLPDGSHIWLNSGSQLSYPPEFSGNSREVYLSGEAFFDITPDPQKPFFVITKDIKIRVLGTRFNVFAYIEEQSTQTVLLEGKVTIGKNAFLAKTEVMEPGERVVYHKKNEEFIKDKVDVNYYTSWLYGYLIFENEPTPEVFKKLERYYNQTIILENGLDNISFSGKLDLKEDIKDVLESITYTSSVKIIREGDCFKVNR